MRHVEPAEDLQGCLPKGWVWALLRDIAELKGGLTKGQKRKPGERCRSIPYLRVANVQRGYLDLEEMKEIEATDKEIEELRLLEGDLLFNEGGDRDKLGRGWIWQNDLPECIHQNHVFRGRLVLPDLQPKFVSWYSNSIGQKYFLEQGKQTTNLASINLTKLGALPVPVPPAAEQRRIVAEIEKQFSDLDAGVAALKRVQANLKRYRASVLKAACEGRLVPTEAELARAEGRDYEPADKLLERILKERHANSMKPVIHLPGLNELFSLPNGWSWTVLGCVLTDIRAGKSFKCLERPPQDDEVGVVKVSSVSWGKFDEEESKTCLSPERVDPELYVRNGDFLFSRANTIELVGACAVAENVSKKVMLSDKILRFQFAYVEPRWVLWVLRSQYGRQEIERLATGNQESMRNIGQERILQIRLPMPPLAEQRSIVADIERRLSLVEKLEDAVVADSKRAERLRQSILKRAFEGKLVPQDPNDEPASVLLNRIRQERDTPSGKSTPGQMSLGLEKQKKPRTPRRRSVST